MIDIGGRFAVGQMYSRLPSLSEIEVKPLN